jgi:hypothetical protein
MLARRLASASPPAKWTALEFSRWSCAQAVRMTTNLALVAVAKE